MFRKTIFFLIGCITYMKSSFGDYNIIPNGETISNNSITIEKVLEFFKDSIFGLLSVIAIGAFIFIGIRLFVAKGNPDEFKKAMMHFVYAVVGIFIVSSAWVVIKFVVGIDI